MTAEERGIVDLNRRLEARQVEFGLAPPSASHPHPIESKSAELLRLADQCEQNDESVMLSMGGSRFWANARMLRFVSALAATIERREAT